MAWQREDALLFMAIDVSLKTMEDGTNGLRGKKVGGKTFLPFPSVSKTGGTLALSLVAAVTELYPESHGTEALRLKKKEKNKFQSNIILFFPSPK